MDVELIFINMYISQSKKKKKTTKTKGSEKWE